MQHWNYSMWTHLRRAANADTAQLLDWLWINISEITSSSLHWLITCLFKASRVSSLRSLLAVIASFPNSGTPNSFSIEQKNFLTSQDKYARSPESNRIPTALYLHGTSWRLSHEWKLYDSLEMIAFSKGMNTTKRLVQAKSMTPFVPFCLLRFFCRN